MRERESHVSQGPPAPRAARSRTRTTTTHQGPGGAASLASRPRAPAPRRAPSGPAAEYRLKLKREAFIHYCSSF